MFKGTGELPRVPRGPRDFQNFPRSLGAKLAFYIPVYVPVNVPVNVLVYVQVYVLTW